MFTRRKILAMCAIVTATAPAFGQSYPARPVTLIVPFPERTAVDQVARVVAKALAQELGQPVDVRNVPGRSGTTGAGEAAKAAADGYTVLLSGDAAITTASAVYEKLPYDPVDGLTPIARLFETSNVVVVQAGSTAKSIADLVALIKAKPDAAYAHVGVAFSSHVVGEGMRQSFALGIKSLEIPQPAEIVSALEAGRIQFAIMGLSAASPLIAAGKLRALAKTGDAESAPDVPRLAEAGYVGPAGRAWFSLLGPKGLSDDIVRRLNTAAQKAMTSKDVADALKPTVAKVVVGTPSDLADAIKAQIRTIAPLMKDVPKIK